MNEAIRDQVFAEMAAIGPVPKSGGAPGQGGREGEQPVAGAGLVLINVTPPGGPPTEPPKVSAAHCPQRADELADGPAPQRSGWWGRAWVAFWLLVAAVAFGVALIGTFRGQLETGEDQGPRLKAIQDVRVGDRVAADGPVVEDDDELAQEVEPATWRRLGLRAPKTDGSFAEVELLRPQSWLAEQQGRVGGTVEFDVPECGISGQAEVLSIQACPPIKPGKGHVVTGTFKHTINRVLDVYLEGQNQPLGVTPNHPCWSEDRQQFVRADELRVGERLRGQSGTPRVLRVAEGRAPQQVYNLEVQGTHVYRVTQAGLLVHNANPGIGYIYEITYVNKAGETRVYVGSNIGDVYERLWGTKTGINRNSTARDVLATYPNAEVRIWQVDLTGASKPRDLLFTQEQHAKEEVMRTRGEAALVNYNEARIKEPMTAYKNSKKKRLPEAEQKQIREEIQRLQAEGKRLPQSTPTDRPIDQMSKYDRDTLRYGDRRGNPVVEGTAATAKEQARLLCGR
jgi:hypothetical protein